MTNNEVQVFKDQVIDALRSETHEALKGVGKTWVKEAVEETLPAAIEATLKQLGIDYENPRETYKDMLYLREIRIESKDRKKSIMDAAWKWVTVAGLGGAITMLGTWVSKIK